MAISVNFLCGILYVVIAIPLVRRKIAPNRWYGVRTRASFASEEAWYAINERFGKLSIVCGGALLMLATGLLLATWRCGPLSDSLSFAASMAPMILLVACIPSIFDRGIR